MSGRHGVVIEAGGAMPPATAKVWDPFVRVFHWSLATLFVVAYVSGDEAQQVHIAVGYAIVGLITLRIIWGFVGPRHARFSNFVRSPREVLGYLRDVATFRAPRYLGHNPAGGAMIIALLVMLAGTGMTGYMMTTDAFWGAKWVEEVHETFRQPDREPCRLARFRRSPFKFRTRREPCEAMITGRKQRS